MNAVLRLAASAVTAFGVSFGLTWFSNATLTFVISPTVLLLLGLVRFVATIVAGVLAAAAVLVSIGVFSSPRPEYASKRAGRRLFVLGLILISVVVTIHLATSSIVLQPSEEGVRVGLWSMAFGELLFAVQLMGATMATFGALIWLARDAAG